MVDLIIIVGIIAFFVLTIGLIKGIERIKEG
jgi:hypothetical protein